MPSKKYSKEKIIEILRNISTQLGKEKLTKHDVSKVLSLSTVSHYFGSLGNALTAAGLERTGSGENFRGRGDILSNDDLFIDLFHVEINVGHEPGCSEYQANGKFSDRPYRKRFGKWDNVLTYYRKWKSENPDKIEGVKALATLNNFSNSAKPKTQSHPGPKVIPSYTRQKSPGQFYGEQIAFRGLQHAPINEQGVVYLFGMISRELGFNIEALQQGFPDCEGKYLCDQKKNLWAKARIEFEFLASNFKEHSHDPSQCDFIVCWENDWPDCPINVIELKTEILKLSSKQTPSNYFFLSDPFPKQVGSYVRGVSFFC